MASQVIDISNLTMESQQVIELIRQGKSFLLSGGAGSGKTYSLVEILKTVLEEKPTLSVACITYTNAAVDEIESRVHHDHHLQVSTIHDFLWGNIKHFHSELKQSLIELINDEEQPKIKSPTGEHVPDDFLDGIEEIKYKEFVRLKDGIVSHDEVLLLASKMYEKYKKLCSITKDSYSLILVDEYQDTDPQVVEILLKHLDKSPKDNIVGFFGDAMQSIYDGSVGNLNEYLQLAPPPINEVQKTQNRRNPELVINLANQIRTDGLVQIPSTDTNAPNMNDDGTVKQGNICFIYSDNDDLNAVRHHLDWDFSNSKQTKELNLTHNLIANKAGFYDLMRIYDKDLIRAYVKRIKDYINKEQLDLVLEGKSFKDILEEIGALEVDAHKSKKPTPMQQTYIAQYHKAYQSALAQPYNEITRLYVDKDKLIDDKKNHSDDSSKPSSSRDNLIKHLFKIEHCIHLYQEKQFNKFTRITDFSINNVANKIQLKKAIDDLIKNDGETIGHVLEKANELGLVMVDDKLEHFKEYNTYIYQQVCDIPYKQFRCLYQYLEGFTPFSTQHKTKGAEFQNVLVVLDNGKWNSYNFNCLFEGGGKDSVRHRTEKIFYVCCTRAKENLAIFFHKPNQNVIAKARQWFGEENVIRIDN